MKTKLLIVLMAAALMLTISGTTQAVPLKAGPLLFKTYNWEVGTGYFGGTAGMTYFRDAAATYYKSDGTEVTYSAANPSHRLFSDLFIAKDPSLNPDEDTWALLEVRQLEQGAVLGGGNVGDSIGPQTPADIYWNAGDNDEYMRGVLWGGQDQAVEFLTDELVRIYSTGGQFNLYEMDTTTWNPQAGGNPTPSDRDLSKPDEFDPGGGFDPWIEDTGNNLLFQGGSSWFRFSGDLDDLQPGQVDPGFPLPSGETTVYLDVDPDEGRWGQYFQNWWGDPPFLAGDDGRSDIWQTWNIGDPVQYGNGWVGSEDSGRAYIVPEPITMLGVFLGVSSLTGYIRKRRMA